MKYCTAKHASFTLVDFFCKAATERINREKRLSNISKCEINQEDYHWVNFGESIVKEQ